MTQSVPEVPDMRQPRKNPADRAYLLRVIARTVTESLPVPMTIETSPEHGFVTLRFDNEAVAAVEAWAQMLGVDLVREDVGQGWHCVGNDSDGTPWHGWALHVWCKVAGPAQQPVAADATAVWPAASPVGGGEPAVLAPARPVTGLFADASVEFPRLIWPAPVKDPALREDEVTFA